MEKELEKELKEAQELIKKLYKYLGGSAELDCKLWRETKTYCIEKNLVSENLKKCHSEEEK